jgi:hypothetical protein
MPIVEHTARRLVLQSGSTMLALDRDVGKAKMQRKVLFWQLRPAETPLADVKDIVVDKTVDRASGVELFSTVLITSDGAGWALPAADQKEAQANAAQLRSILGLAS